MRLVLGFSDIRLRTYFNKLMILLPNFVEFTLISPRRVEHFLNPLFDRLFHENKIIRNHMNCFCLLRRIFPNNSIQITILMFSCSYK